MTDLSYFEYDIRGFAVALEAVANLRNYGDGNPVVIDIQHPVANVSFRLIASYTVPSRNFAHLNSVWVCTDSTSRDYQKSYRITGWEAAPSDEPGDLPSKAVLKELRLFSDLWVLPQVFRGEALAIPEGNPGDIVVLAPNTAGPNNDFIAAPLVKTIHVVRDPAAHPYDRKLLSVYNGAPEQKYYDQATNAYKSFGATSSQDVVLESGVNLQPGTLLSSPATACLFYVKAAAMGSAQAVLQELQDGYAAQLGKGIQFITDETSGFATWHIGFVLTHSYQGATNSSVDDAHACGIVTEVRPELAVVSHLSCYVNSVPEDVGLVAGVPYFVSSIPGKLTSTAPEAPAARCLCFIANSSNSGFFYPEVAAGQEVSASPEPEPEPESPPAT